MNPHYYLMKSKKILRLEADVSFDSLPTAVKDRALDPIDLGSMDQNQANWRVVIFRDEIMELGEYEEWLLENGEESVEECELDLTAN